MDISAKLASNVEELSKLFETRMSDYESRLNNATTSPGSKPQDLATLSSEFQSFKNFVYLTLSKLKEQIELLSLGQDRHETHLRKNTLLFHGLAEEKEENLRTKIVDILTDKLKLVDIDIDDLAICHRLGKSTKKSRAVLVRFRDLEHRRAVWDAKSALKNTGITISEFLTKSRHTVFMAARKRFGITNCWSSDGKILIILPDSSRRKIEVMSELQALFQAFPASSEPSSGAEEVPIRKADPSATTARKPGGFAPKKPAPAGTATRSMRPR